MNIELAAALLGNPIVKVTLYLSALFFLRYVAVEVILTSAKLRWTQEQRLKAIGNIRLVVIPLALVGALLLATNEFKSGAILVFSGSVAIVLAFKELILCLLGYIILLVSKPYQLGDRIEINTSRGDVVYFNFLTTTLMEVGMQGVGNLRTGRQISFPNSLLLTHLAFNETFVDNFALLNLSIPLSIREDLRAAKTLLLEIAQGQCSAFLDKVHRRAQERSRRNGIESPVVHPQVFIALTSPNELRMTLRVACPMHLRNQIEQTILTGFLEQFPRVALQG